MSKKAGTQTVNSEAFDKYRDSIMEEFTTEKIFHKRRMTQGAFWTAIDKDLANQYFRDECWLFNFKYKDEIKFIDHGVDAKANINGGAGFLKR